MPDSRLPDHWLGDPRFDGLSDAGWRILTHGYMWSNRYLTDGRIPHKSLRHLGTHTQDEALAELVEMGLIELDGEAIYLDWKAQTSRETFLSQREGSRERMAARRSKQRELLSYGVTPPVTPSVTPPVSPPVSRRGEARTGEDLDTYIAAEPDDIF